MLHYLKLNFWNSHYLLLHYLLLHCVNVARYYVPLFRYCIIWCCIVFLFHYLMLLYSMFHHFNVALFHHFDVMLYYLIFYYFDIKLFDVVLFNVTLFWWCTILMFPYVILHYLSCVTLLDVAPFPALFDVALLKVLGNP